MRTDTLQGPEECTCLAIRQAARHITQFYDQHLTPVGLRITQFSILAKLRRLGPMTINALADELVMDRTTLGRNILPLVREGLLSIAPGRTDRRSRELRLTKAGIERLGAARKGWSQAQTHSQLLSVNSSSARGCARFPRRPHDFHSEGMMLFDRGC